MLNVFYLIQLGKVLSGLKPHNLVLFERIIIKLNLTKLITSCSYKLLVKSHRYATTHQ